METSITDTQIRTIMTKVSEDSCEDSWRTALTQPVVKLWRQCQDALDGDDAARTALVALLPVFVD